MSHPDPRQAPDLLVDSIRQFSGLMQKEVQLAKAEVSHNLNRAGIGLALIVIAALLAFTALHVLAGAAVAYIAATGVSAGSSAIIVAVALLVVAAGLVLAAKARLSAAALAPTHAIRNIKRDATAMKGTLDA